MGKNIYYTTLDNWYISKYINISSNKVDMIIANIHDLLMDLRKWKAEDIQVTTRKETVHTPYGLIFFTYDKELAEKVFTKGYRVAEKQTLLKKSSADLLSSRAPTAEVASLAIGKAKKLKDSLIDAFVRANDTETCGESLQAEVEERLPDELFDDLEEIGLSTVDRDIRSEDEGDPLPEDLFFDLAERPQAPVQTKVNPKDKGVK